ncbi:MAG: signal peptidase I [Candidatus Moraniibacteriota bacterium]
MILLTLRFCGEEALSLESSMIRLLCLFFLCVLLFGGAGIFVWKMKFSNVVPVLNNTCPHSLETRIVRGVSMEPLFLPGDTIKVSFGWYACHIPERDDSVLASFLGNESPILKRIRGIPDDAFGVSILPDGEGIFLVNNETLKNSLGVPYHLPPVRAELWKSYQEQFHGIVPPNSFLIFGEVATGSLDSSQFGFVARKNLLGKVWGR